MASKWIIARPGPSDLRTLAAALGVSELTALLLLNRGISDPALAQRFLRPSLHDLTDPCRLPDVEGAARLLLDAVRSGKRIAVFGDYDADGICAAALLVRCLRHLGAEPALYIPDRSEEGYGLNKAALKELADGGTRLVVTVDCGVSAREEAALARELGVELIITDHHEPNGSPPEAALVLNPKLPGCELGYRHLAGVGVAFKLMWSIGQQLSAASRVSEEFKDLLMEALSLVAIGTIADVCPLVDENRVLVSYGLKTLSVSPRPGMRALMAAARLAGGPISARDVAFRLAPRLNAAGRMGDAKVAVELLMTEDARLAAELAAQLEAHNNQRVKTQNATIQQAEEALQRSRQLEGPGCIVLADPNWHPGVLGLVASRLVDRHGRPAFIFTLDGEVARGSARSVPGFPLNRVLGQCQDLLSSYGGHEGAAGLSLPAARLDAFIERVNACALELVGGEPSAPALRIDGEVQLGALNPLLLREINALAPFGEGNPEPCFVASGLRLAGNPQTVGSRRSHLSFIVRQGRDSVRVIAMNRARWLEELLRRRGEPFSLAFEPYLNTYRGSTTLELRACDIRWDADGDASGTVAEQRPAPDGQALK